MSAPPIAPRSADRDWGHPHRCGAGHRWQHTGPAALTCQVPVHDSASGNLPLVSAEDCPLCSGREELLVRGVHLHYCNICEGDWDHEGRCLEGFVAWCPWCFPQFESGPVPGGRRGAHYHFCPDCAQNWQHVAMCAEPLRVALPECSGCLASRQRRPSSRAARAIRDRVAPFAIPAGLAAAVIVATPILLKYAWLAWTPALGTATLVYQQSAGLHSAISVRTERDPRTEREPETPLPRRPASDSVAPEPPSDTVSGEPESQPRPTEVPLAPGPSLPPIALPTPTPAPSSRERVVVELPPPSVLGAPSFGHMDRGAVVLDATPDSHPQLPGRDTREAKAPGASEPMHGLPTWTGESPRWDRGPTAELLQAVVDIRAAGAGSGRGFIVDQQGYILTNGQVVSGATSVKVTLYDGRTLPAIVVVRDRLNDMAVLKIERGGLPVMRLGDSAALVVGERVFAAGNGRGLERTPTMAVVRATGAGTGGNLAIDLAPRREGVGGPLLNRHGHAVGIVTDGAPVTGGRQRLTFATPLDRVKPVLVELMRRPVVGAALESQTQQ